MIKEIGSPLRYALFIAGGLIAYFLILKGFGLHENPWLRMFNGFVVALGIYSSIRFNIGCIKAVRNIEQRHFRKWRIANF